MKLTRKSEKKVKISFFDLLSNTSTIHGVKYIGDYQSPRASRTFWICAFCLSILGCIYYATQVYDKWYVTPDIGLKVEYKSARSIPFPAITICPQTKIKRDFLNFSSAFNAANDKNSIYNLTNEEKKHLEMALQVCTPGNAKLTTDEFRAFPTLESDEIVKLMSNDQFAINETVLLVKIGSQFYSGFDKMTRVLTSEGFCTTFNIEDYSNLFRNDTELSEDFQSYSNGQISEYDLYQGYRHNNASIYPLRILTGGRNTITFIMAQKKLDIDEGCRGPDQGFKVYWHMPNEIPGYWHRSFLIDGAESRTIIMKSTRTTTSDDLRRYEVKQRRCYYEKERTLNFFKNYTKSHCDLECLTQYVNQTCGCVKFYMPRNSSMPVCDIQKLPCADEAEFTWLENDKDYLKNEMPCNCYPACASLKYEIVMNTDTKFDTDETLKKFGDAEEFYRDFPTGQMSRLIIYFEDFLIEDQENYLGYKMQHFISDCGGLLGLFMGCSILSLVELIYQFFATIFFKQNTTANENDENKHRAPTPMNDKKAIVLRENDNVVIVG